MILFFLPFLTGGRFSLLHEAISPIINGLTELISGSGARAFS